MENAIMPISQQKPAAAALASLYIDALRQGQSLWFRVASGSMRPILQVGDEVRIEPATADKIRSGEIAAFETTNGLVIHRIVQRKQTETDVRLLEMSDVHLHPNWVEAQTIVGRVILARRDTRQINLQHPVAQMCGTVTAQLRYRFYCLYTHSRFDVLRTLLHRSSRLVVFIGYWCMRSCSASLRS
jgi:signal peptidase I